MRTPKGIILLLMLFFSLTITAQYSDFDLSGYKLPDVKVNRLDANMNLANFTSGEKHKMYYTDTTESSGNSFQGSVSLNFYHFRNTEKYQGSLEFSGNAYFNPSNNKYENYNTKRNSVTGNFMVLGINRFYNQKMNFIEIDPIISSYTQNNKDELESDNTMSQYHQANDFNSTFSIPVSIGHGRIEPVEDVRLAIYILEELNKVGRIANLPADNLVLEMAKEISKIKSQRFFDSRLKKIRELQVIDSFLVANNIVTTNDINYFAVLNDQWDYASGPVRNAGFSIDAGIDDHIILNRLHEETELNGESQSKSESYINKYDISVFFRARYSKPINLYWQTSATFITHAGYEFTKNPKDGTNPEENYTTNFFNTNLTYSLQYLPDSRTSIALILSGNYKNLKGDRTLPVPEPSLYEMKENQFNIYSGINMYYYVSPRMRLQFDSYLNYRTLQNRNTNDTTAEELKSFSKFLHHDFAFTLIYSFF